MDIDGRGILARFGIDDWEAFRGREGALADDRKP
jgi:hypothetical protein